MKFHLPARGRLHPDSKLSNSSWEEERTAINTCRIKQTRGLREAK
jgi:hypothetical protein